MALKFRTRAERHHGAHLTGREHEIRPKTADRQAAPQQQSAMDRTAWTMGRLIFGGYFLYNGINHFANRDMLIGYAKSKGVAWPEVAVLGSGAMLIVGGLSLLTGVKQKVGASLVTAFLTGVTPTMHDYWNATDQTQRMNEIVNFGKNLALLGGALLAATGQKSHQAAA